MLRQEINMLLPDVIRQTAEDRNDVQALDVLRRDVGQLQDMLLGSATLLPPELDMEGKRFLNDLEDGVRLLRQSDARLYFTPKYRAQGKTVQEVVDYMTRTGPLFAPSVGGDEAVYVAVYHALVGYDLALRGGPVLTRKP